MQTDVELARELAGLTDPKPKACWPNSIQAMLALRLDGKALEAVAYVEGWLLICEGQVAIEHGWLHVAGKIVDVTLPGEYDGEMYYPVHVLTYDQALRRLGRRTLPLFVHRERDRLAMNQKWGELPCNQDMDNVMYQKFLLMMANIHESELET